MYSIRVFLFQFCDAGIAYGSPTCGTSFSSTTKILIKGGTVVNAHQQELADVYIENGIIVAVQRNLKVKFFCHLHYV